MALAVGTRIGPYEILALIGAGGMGEVYRATDPRLGREVALKILSAGLPDDADYMARFQREARVLASLNHPHIAIIHGLEESGGVRALVMELVEGPTLADRIAQRTIPLEEVLPIAAQIADGLEAAHEKGIIHRDLKPANVKLTLQGAVKLLDFGLAKAAEETAPASVTPNSPTLTMRATQMGVIMGTAAYMSPEQAAGKPVDKRSDIWSFGVVLWEMLTGEGLFSGETISHTLADVLRAPIDFSKLPKGTPTRLRDLLRRCLERNVRNRLRDIGEVRILLEDCPTSEVIAPIAPPSSRSSHVLGAAAGLFLITTLAISVIHFRERLPAPEVTRFQISAPEKVTIGAPLGSILRLSPDGRRLAFIATAPDGHSSLWVRSLDSLEVRRLAGTDGAAASLWSPDGRFLVFAVGGKLKKIDISGGPPQTLCDIPAEFYGGDWNRDGTIIFAIGSTGLRRVSANGGVDSKLTDLDAQRQESFHSPPAFLPDGKHFLYFRFSPLEQYSGIYIGTLDAKPEQQSLNRLLATDFSALYAPPAVGAMGHLIFLREATLLAQPLDSSRLELSGEAVPIAQNVGAYPANGWFSASKTGVLAYRTSVSEGEYGLTWFDRSGSSVGTLDKPGWFTSVALSSDGTRAAFARDENLGTKGSRNSDIWINEFAGNTSTQLTFDSGAYIAPVWSPDGRRIVFASNRDGSSFSLYQKPSNGAGRDELLLKTSTAAVPYDWSSNGRFLLYSNRDQNNGALTLWSLPFGPHEEKPVLYVDIPGRASTAQFSPDGRFIAYTSDSSGLASPGEIYVQPFPLASSGKWKLGNGNQPRWRRDGKELFYVSNDSRLMAVDVTTIPTFKAGVPHALFPVRLVAIRGLTGASYDVTADGKKFLIIAPANAGTAATSPPITVVLNWEAGLKK